MTWGFSIRCLKNTLPQVNTTSIINVTPSTALATGEVISDADQNTTRGFCYSTTSNPTISNDTTMNGTGLGVYSGTLQNLTPLTTYYVRAYATNSLGTSYGNELSFLASLPSPQSCPGTPSVTDIDGNLYHTVQIGNQCWTQSNLKVSKYRNGDNIPTGLSNSDWGNTMNGAFATYNNDTGIVRLYGQHYNGYAVNDVRGLCPTGWQVPTDNELTALVNYLGGDSIAGGHLKSVNVGFSLPNSGATNFSGFSGMAAGSFGPIGGNGELWVNGYFWSRNTSNSNLAWVRNLHYLDTRAHRNQYGMTWGFSVRCLKNTLPQVNTTSATNVTPSTALVTGEVISDGGDQNTTRGFCYSTTTNPSVSNDTTMNGTGLGVYSGTLQNLTPSTSYYVRAYATNSVGTSYGNEVSFTTDSLPGLRCPGTPSVTDIDGNLYHTVQIGNQCWTQSNLKVSKYRNGDNIPTGLSNSAWENTTSGAYAIYNNNPVNDVLYGKLYNHFTVTDSRGLCPTGWHVPSDGEWNIMVKYLDPSADTVCGDCSQSGIAGGALKSTATQPTTMGWNSPNTGATNTSGFTAQPGGLRYIFGDFSLMTNYGWWWSSSVSSGSVAWNRTLYSSNSIILRGYSDGQNGFSVRCLKD
jgi:uncharacterized protein (TIGR02145 family)